jgi:hypothetical protein
MIAALTSVSAFTSGFGDIRNAAEGWMNLPLIAGFHLGRRRRQRRHAPGIYALHRTRPGEAR